MVNKCLYGKPMFFFRYLHIPATEGAASFISRRRSVGLPQLHLSSNGLPSRRGSEPALSRARGLLNGDRQDSHSAFNPQDIRSSQQPCDHLIKYGMRSPLYIEHFSLSVHFQHHLHFWFVIGQILTQFLESLESRVQRCLKHVQQIKASLYRSVFWLDILKAI